MFGSQRKSLIGRTDILRQKIEQLRSQIDGLAGQALAEDEQIALLNEELVGAEALFAQHLEGNIRLLEIKRNAAALEGSRAGHIAAIAQTEQTISETRLEIINLVDEREAEAARDLKDVQARLAEKVEALRAAEDVLRRTAIRAPIGGVVMDLRYFTEGGVVERGASILDLVPQTNELVLAVQVSPLDIDVVEAGLPAQVRLTAFRQRQIPVLDGQVTYVSADSFIEEQTGLAYYKALIEIDAKQLARLQENIQLYPGMPVEGLILTGSRTLWGHLIAPIQDSFARAFREQ